MSKLFSWYFKSNLLMRILVALALGAVLGLIFQDAPKIIAVLTPLGELFVRLLKMIVVPVIASTLIVGASSIAPSQLGRIGVKTLLYYTTTSIFAIIIGLGVGTLIKPGLGLELNAEMAVDGKTAEAPSILQILLEIVPTNPIGVISDGQVLPMIFFCLLFGIALAFGRDSSDENVKKSSDTVFYFVDGVSQAMFKIVGWVMQYAPIGVFALIFIVFSKNGATAFGSLASVTGAVYLGLALQVFLVYCVICALFRLSPVTFLKKVRPAFITAFVTRSSGATLPVSIQSAESMGVPKNVYSFGLPVGSTMNMDGTTVYLGVCAIFIANAVGMPLTPDQMMTVTLTAVLAAVGTAGVPGAGAIMLLMVLESVGLPVEAGSAVAVAYGMILGIEALLDMGRTSMNVVGDVAGVVTVAKQENTLDKEAWDS
ncbi:dicarboxylate/amino acid:cation symporter [Moraxella equi]|uniref:Dicarboxylate/amino acid:cation symporter n=1 Tax=Moraxella equi TaxID=60442 RepID=A0A378QU20_9GAMM|nr:dicarboxylate/amino acid:cation symporter [Moraxella equi]OPH39485.1 dicarboxylate/amino acid:cation symporter [Moraxella equi]STZ04419.1 Glutamate-aspartate carrier protein [Moraxella equi]